jgi:hypothetical protein
VFLPTGVCVFIVIGGMAVGILGSLLSIGRGRV